MSYVIYDTDTTIILRDPLVPYYKAKEMYETERAAKAARTRILRKITESGKANLIDRFAGKDFAIAETRHFYDNIEKQETKVNLMSGKEFTQGVNTPRCCDPSSETYWSM